MKLIIAEKPSLGKAIADWLGITKKTTNYIECKNDYVVTWAFGHLLELQDAHEYHTEWKNWSAPLPIWPHEFKLKLRDDSGVKNQFNSIQFLLNRCIEVINAGDPDREGQLLIDEILEYNSNNKPVKRLWLSAIDDKSIDVAFKQIKSNSEYIGYKLAAETRQRADWLIGINYTQAFTKRFQSLGYDGVVTIGRVQTPTLKLIVDRDNEISNFKPKNFYELVAIFNKETPPVVAKLIIPNTIRGLMDEESRLLEKKPLEEIAEIIKNNSAIVKHYSKQRKITNQPLLFNLSELQSIANKSYGYSAQNVLDVAQMLYENKLTTYPRTDCQYLPESQFQDATNILNKLVEIPQFSHLQPDTTIKSLVWNDSKVTAHHAIIPTGAGLDNLAPILNGLGKHSEAGKNIFNIICYQYIAQFYPKLQYDEVDIILEVMSYQFKALGKTIVTNGWKSIFGIYAEEDTEINNEDNQILPVLNIGQTSTCIDTNIITKTTTKPKPYTEGSLIKAMTKIHFIIPDLVKQFGYTQDKTELLIKQYKTILKETAGLGTEATRSSIIETLKNKKLIKLDKKSLLGTELGHNVINSISSSTIREVLGFLSSPLTTAEYEQKLDEICTTGNITSVDSFWKQFTPQFNVVANFNTLDLTIPVNSMAFKCENCIKSEQLSVLKLLDGQYGKYWKCFTCNSNFKDNNGKPILSSSPKPEIKPSGEKCPECGNDLVERNGKFGKFIACNGYPKCKWMPPKADKPQTTTTDKNCPTCKTGMLVIRNSVNGKFFGCNKFPKCNHIEQINKE
ncbi:MAG: DNA topoisomerase 3 [Burkholderiales bacterium]|nr:DNA topoisomerase 3 [Burkholderiales bacterium]